ncbi:DMT family transporter [Puteibacter caeruleilacunae]|nr:DMT family transporter [Puteibacter caeruleilacunae]
MNNTIKGTLLAGTTAFLWGFLSIALKVADADVDPMTIVWFRFTLAFVILATIHGYRNPQELKVLIKPPVLLIVAALCLGTNYVGYMHGIHFTSPGNTQVIIQMGPILLGVSGVLFFKERLSRIQLIGFSIAAIGFILFYQQQLGMMVGQESSFKTGALWVVLAAVAWTGYAVLQKILVRTMHPQTINLILYGLPMLLFIPFADFKTLAGLSTGEWTLMAFLGLNTLVAYGTLAAAFKYIEANKISIIITMNPVITFAAMAVLSLMEVTWIAPEKINWFGALGGVLVLTGAVLVVMKRK